MVGLLVGQDEGDGGVLVLARGGDGGGCGSDVLVLVHDGCEYGHLWVRFES